MPVGTWWVERHPDTSLAGQLDEAIHKRKPDLSNDDVFSRPTLQRCRVWLEPLGPAKLAKVRSTIR